MEPDEHYLRQGALGMLRILDRLQDAEADRERLRARVAELEAKIRELDGMASCMDMVRQELIEAGVIDKSVSPMFVANAVLSALAAARQPVEAEPVACGACHGSGWVVRDPDIGTEQECFSCDGSGVDPDTTLPAAQQSEAVTDKMVEQIGARLSAIGVAQFRRSRGQQMTAPEQREYDELMAFARDLLAKVKT